MKRKKLISYTAITLLALALLMPSIPAYAAEPDNVIVYTTYGNQTEWIYQTFGLHLYRRLYDRSSHIWIGEWELVY